MKNLEQIKNNILGDINSGIINIFKEVEVTINEITLIDIELQKKKKELSNITDTYNNTVNANKQEKGIILNSLNALKEREQEFSIKRNLFENDRNSWLSNLDSIRNEIDRLNTNKTILLKEIEKGNSLIKVKDELTVEVKDLRKDKINLGEELNILIKENQDIKDGLTLNIDELRKTKKEEEKHILPTIEELNTKAKMLDQREKDLSVVEQRFKKLYAVHGSSFRV